MLTNYRKVGLVVVPLLIAAAFVNDDRVSIGLSAVALVLAVVAIVVTVVRRPRADG